MTDKHIRIACVGDSITRLGYPEILEDLLGSYYTVGNFGIDGATASKTLGNGISYWDTPHFTNALNFNPDIVTIQLGTNDSRDMNWPLSQGEFYRDYASLVERFRIIPSKPEVILCFPPAAFKPAFEINNSVIINEIIPIIQRIADEKGLETMDNYSAMLDHADLLYDGVHPGEKGSRKLAEIFKEKLT